MAAKAIVVGGGSRGAGARVRVALCRTECRMWRMNVLKVVKCLHPFLRDRGRCVRGVSNVAKGTVPFSIREGHRSLGARLKTRSLDSLEMSLEPHSSTPRTLQRGRVGAVAVRVPVRLSRPLQSATDARGWEESRNS